MKRSVLFIMALVLTLMMGLSTLSVSATDIYPDLLETVFDKNGVGYNNATFQDLEAKDPGKTPVTVYDEKAEAYFLRTSTSDPTNYFVSKEATDILGRFFKVYEVEDSEFDSSFSWEFMVRLPEMPTAFTYGSGYFASGGFTFAADADKGYLMVESGTTDDNAVDSLFQFDMEANTWYHCILIYDDFEHQFYAFVNGEKIKTADGAEFVRVEPFRLSYLWHWGLRIGGGNIERDVELSQDVAICNVYSQIIPDQDVVEIYNYAAETWGLADVASPSETPESTQDVSQTTMTPDDHTPDATPPSSSETMLPTDDIQPNEPAKKDGGSSNVLLIVAIVGAVLVIGGGIVAGILVTKKK